GDTGEGEAFLMASSLFDGAGIEQQPMPCGEGAALVAADRELVDVATRPLEDMHAPRAALASLSADFDLCVIDTAPTLGQPLYA
ncbi:ParA family protein, partial [Acinetobacter baumannii]